ncbi:acetolactate synthase-1/2/3 large subunit [Pseudonocardia sediminis]|uniref:Acetolactate synthase-1/2/3 large subunit n=1 Tax=Pseudonocardia sediminis TaxID=1397368 RepID=A0A4Q7V4Q1_PSEST|nr:thiamine pyrophosphate-binding protein [Pseudonocardia sediminis]RZT88658.1 acetolactate synthase-1/2/3 large subunit [Pseudonocardia sediminis]
MSAEPTIPRAEGPSPQAAGAWAAIVDVLDRAGVSTLFGLPADDIALLRALAGRPRPDVVVARDQRAAAYMAIGHAQASGQVGVVVVGKGPAVTTVSTGVLEAATAGTPLLVLAAGTPAARRDTGAFQELDQVAVMSPLVRRALRADAPERVVPLLRHALLTATGPVPGPVYLEIPDDLLEVPVPVPDGPVPPPERAVTSVLPGDARASRLVAGARRPVVLAGGGVRSAAAGADALALAEGLGAPLFVTASGRGAVDEDHPHFAGVSGLYAPEETAELWAETDLVVALGSRLEETATYGWPETVGTDVPVVQVNRVASEFSTGFEGPLVLGDAGPVARGWAAGGAGDARWRARVRDSCARAAARSPELPDPSSGRPPRVLDVLAVLEAELPADRVLVGENGLADMWTYHWPAYTCRSVGGWVVPSEQTPLGFGVAAAAGVKKALGGRCVVAVVGDGAFTLVDADLPTLVDAGLAVLYVVVDNGGYGWLESQRSPGDGVAAGTFAAPRGHPPTLTDPRVHHEVVTDLAGLVPAVRAAYGATRSGRVAVVHVPIGLDDGPHAESVLEGDFPHLAGT